MATGSKRSCCSICSTSPSSDSESSASVKRTRRQVRVTTFKQWKSTYEREYQTLTWLCCKKERRSISFTSGHSVCLKFESHIQSLKNFSVAWITGSSNHRASNIIDHGKNEQHKTAMNLEKIERAKANKQDMSSYSALARSFKRIDEATREKLRKKFDIAYVLAKEHMAFKKYPVIYALESRHGIDLGQA